MPPISVAMKKLQEAAMGEVIDINWGYWEEIFA